MLRRDEPRRTSIPPPLMPLADDSTSDVLDGDTADRLGVDAGDWVLLGITSDGGFALPNSAAPRSELPRRADTRPPPLLPPLPLLLLLHESSLCDGSTLSHVGHISEPS
jgi:hypothetical protein